VKYWLDTEFLEDGKTIDLMSIGIVAEDGREYYAQVIQPLDFNERLTPWLRENVLPHMTAFDWKDRSTIRTDVLAFCDREQHGKPEFWGYYADYDWVVLCQLFGTMMDLPKGWPMYCRDIKQWCDDLGNPTLPEQGKGEHHALADARWNRKAWKFLSSCATRANVTESLSPA
jgi:hypothetical protein